MSLRRRLVRLYPRAWRERYGDEFEALLDECLHSPMDVLDIALGALDAHLGLPHEGNWRSMNMVNKRRTAILMVFSAYIVFIIAGLSLYGLVDDSPAVARMATDPALSAAWRVVQAGAVVALLAIVIGGLPLALTTMRRALRRPGGDLRLLLVPVMAFAALVLYGVFLASVATGSLHLPGVLPRVSPDDFPLGNRLLLAGFMLTFILGAAASTVAVWRLLNHDDAPESTFHLLGLSTTVRFYEYAFPLSVIAAMCMLVMLLATLTFGWLAAAALPDWFRGFNGLLLTRTTLSFATTITLMAFATALACFGLARGFAARRASLT